MILLLNQFDEIFEVTSIQVINSWLNHTLVLYKRINITFQNKLKVS